jgi:putative FmdB family regulatory protein
MPIYEFRCTACDSRFEELVPVGASPERCPVCGAEAPERVFSAQAGPFNLVRAPRGARKQERKNATLREATKERLKQARERRARAGTGGAQGGDG